MPREQLDAAVDEMCDKLMHKLSGCIRYAKQPTCGWTIRSDWLGPNTISALPAGRRDGRGPGRLP